MELTMCCPTLFGLEGIVADELRFGGKLNDVHAENGRVFFEGDENTLAWAQSQFALRGTCFDPARCFPGQNV